MLIQAPGIPEPLFRVVSSEAKSLLSEKAARFYLRGAGVRIFGRSDCCQCRAQKLKVELFTTDGVKTWTDVDSLGTQ